MSASTGDVVVLVVFGLLVAGWLLWVASGLLVLFTLFVMGLPSLVALLLFILFPPSLIAFLMGYVLMQLGVGQERKESFPES